jgi:hypothetical protein
MTKRSLFKRAWEGWKSFGRKLGDVQARLILTVFYFVVVAPFSLPVRFFSDPLSLKPKTARGWIARSNRTATEAQRASEQF